MKITHLRGLQSFLSDKGQSEFPAAIVVQSQDDFERREAVQLIMAATTSQVVQQSGDQLSVQQLRDELNSSSLFSSRTIVHLTEGDKLSAQAIEEVAVFCQSPGVNHTLLIETNELKTALLKAVADQAVVVALAAPPPWERKKALVSWLLDRARAQKVTLSSPAAELMVRRCGTDKRLLAQELDKLACYASDRPVDEAAVEALCVAVSSESIWELGGAVQQRQPKRAVEIWRDLAEQQMAPLAVLGALRSQLQTGYRLSSALARGADRNEVAREAPQLSGRLLETNISIAQSYGVESYRHALLELYSAELIYKSENPPESTLMEMLLVKLTRKLDAAHTSS